MNDDQLTRYAAIEARLPEGFPRTPTELIPSRPQSCLGGRWRKRIGVGRGSVHELTDLERLGFGVLVLRAGLEWTDAEIGRRGLNPDDAEWGRYTRMNDECSCALCYGPQKRHHNLDLIDRLLTALESAYPEGAKA